MPALTDYEKMQLNERDSLLQRSKEEVVIALIKISNAAIWLEDIGYHREAGAFKDLKNKLDKLYERVKSYE